MFYLYFSSVITLCLIHVIRTALIIFFFLDDNFFEWSGSYSFTMLINFVGTDLLHTVSVWVLPKLTPRPGEVRRKERVKKGAPVSRSQLCAESQLLGTPGRPRMHLRTAS